jgi:hypothetical protein
VPPFDVDGVRDVAMRALARIQIANPTWELVEDVHRMPAFGLVGLRFFELVGPTADDHLRLWYESPNVIRLGFERGGAANSANCEWWSNRDLGQVEDVLVALALGS